MEETGCKCQTFLSLSLKWQEETNYKCQIFVAQLVKNPPAMRETWVRSLGWEDPLEKGNGNPLQHSCLENPLDGETVRGVTKSQTRLSTFTFI